MGLINLLSAFSKLFSSQSTMEHSLGNPDMIIIDDSKEYYIQEGYFQDLTLENKIKVINDNFDGINLSKGEFLPSSFSSTCQTIDNITACLAGLILINRVFPVIPRLSNYLIRYFSRERNPSDAIMTSNVSQPTKMMKQAMSIDFNSNNNSTFSEQLTPLENYTQTSSLWINKIYNQISSLF